MTIKLTTTSKTFALTDNEGRYEFAGSLDYDDEWKVWHIHVNLSRYGNHSEKEALMALAETARRLANEIDETVKGMQDAEKQDHQE